MLNADYCLFNIDKPKEGYVAPKMRQQDQPRDQEYTGGPKRLPGSMRELQNVVERAVIPSENDAFVVDGSRLKGESIDSPGPHHSLSVLADREVPPFLWRSPQSNS